MRSNSNARNAVPSQSFSFKRKCLITSARESLSETLRSSEKLTLRLRALKRQPNNVISTNQSCGISRCDISTIVDAHVGAFVCWRMPLGLRGRSRDISILMPCGPRYVQKRFARGPLLRAQSRSTARLGWHYLSDATCLMRPHLFDISSIM